MEIVRLTTPLQESQLKMLKAGDKILLSGTIYTARDAAHAKLIEEIKCQKPLPFQIQGAIIYYVGPTPTRPGYSFGSAGPTTSYRMDSYTPTLLSLGLKAMIGKGKRSQEVIRAMIENQAVYLGAIGGAAALIGKCVKSAKVIAYEELDSEAIRELEVEDLPLTVLIDSLGNNLYEIGPQAYRHSVTQCRLSTMNDLKDIMNIIEQAREYLKIQGINQWQNGEPNEKTILADINRGESYVLEVAGEVVATAALTLSIDTAYENIQEGKWEKLGPYGSIHRVAIKEEMRKSGVSETIVKALEERLKKLGRFDLRVDTHPDNRVMQRFLSRLHYRYCGKVQIPDGMRLAYQKILTEEK